MIGEGLTVTGHSAIDEIVETIEIPDRRFVLGVQWHPEADERSRIIASLVDAARAAQRESGDPAADQRTAIGSA